MEHPRLGYDASRAGPRVRRLSRKPRRIRELHREGRLWCLVFRLLAKGRSGGGRRLRRCLPEEPVKHVSHETIYIAIYAAPSGELRPGLVALLRQHTCARRPRSQGANRQGRLQHSRPVPRGR